MTGFSRRVPLHFLIYGLYELKFWLNHTSPYNISRFKFRNIMEKLTFDHRTTYLPFTFLWNNDMVSDAPDLAFCHLWVIWAHLLAQNTQSIYYLGKFSFEALWRSCLLTTEPPNSLVLFSEIMIRKKKAAQNHFAIFGLYELKFWLRPPSPYNMWRKKFGNLWVKLTFDHRTTEQPTATLYFSLK